MGKQSRRKRGGKAKKQNSTAAADPPKGDSSNTLLQRLRHSDPRTRHAALAALSNTLLDPNSLFHSKRRIHVDLLQAIRERVMDNDLECAQAAAGCLANYISFGAAGDAQQQSVTASWIVVLTERLKMCLTKLKSSSTRAEEAVKANEKLWWALTSQCLNALCSLVEANPEALDRLTKNNSLATLLGLLELGARELEQNKNVAAAEPADVSFQKDVTIYAARTMHAALDDNEELLDQWVQGVRGWDLTQACCKNQVLPVACRLHCAGCLVTARLLSSDKNLQAIVISEAIPLLHSLLEFNLEEATNLSLTYTECFEKWKKEEADDSLEQDVIRKVKERNEPAREIAKRQKAAKKESAETKVKNDDNDDDANNNMEQDNDDANMDEDGKQPETTNARVEMETARDAWNQLLSPLELALEITANLTGLAPTMPQMDDMDMDGEWGPDQEAMVANQQMENDGVLSPLDSSLAQAIVAAQIPNRLIALLKMTCQPLAENVLPDIKDGMEQLQSKCGACLGNCVGEHFPLNVDGLIQELRSALEASLGNPSIANAMTAALRSRSELRKQCQPSDLKLLLKLASSSSSSSCQKEAIEMLGILCSMESHPEDVNRKVCSALMAVSSKRATVLNEVLNSLIDIYGDDECHPGVFVDLNVLTFFQRTTPSFKKVIQCDRDDASEEEVEQWKETALNATRFVSYKKGQL